MDSRWNHFLHYGSADTKATYGVDGSWRIMERSGLSALSLRHFINVWHEELTDYYGEDFGGEKIIGDSDYGDTIIYVLADLRTNIDSTWVPPHIKKKYKRAGKLRRDKLRHQWSYGNPLNRIHGFLIMKEVTNTQHTNVTMCIDTICSTYFTCKRGIGSDLMVLAKDFSKALGAFDIVLEVANEFSGNGHSTNKFPEDEEDEDEEDEEDEDEFSDEDEDEDEDEFSDEDEDEDDESWTPDDNVISILTDELWKKCMRKSKEGTVYYNLDQDYVEAGLWNYFHCAHESEDETGLWSGTERRVISDKDDPKDTEYGGFWYQKGKRSQKELIKFYEKFGFKEDPDVHLDWCMFDDIPYPTMRLSLE